MITNIKKLYFTIGALVVALIVALVVVLSVGGGGSSRAATTHHRAATKPSVTIKITGSDDAPVCLETFTAAEFNGGGLNVGGPGEQITVPYTQVLSGAHKYAFLVNSCEDIGNYESLRGLTCRVYVGKPNDDNEVDFRTLKTSGPNMILCGNYNQ